MEYARDQWCVCVQHERSFLYRHSGDLSHAKIMFFFVFFIEKNLSDIGPAKFLTIIPQELLHMVYLVGLLFTKFPVVFSDAEKAR